MAMLSHMQGKNSDSVGEVSDFWRVPGKRMKRADIPSVMREKRTRSKMKTIVPMVESPEKRCGVEKRRRAMPPVDMVDVYLFSV